MKALATNYSSSLRNIQEIQSLLLNPSITAVPWFLKWASRGNSQTCPLLFQAPRNQQQQILELHKRSGTLSTPCFQLHTITKVDYKVIFLFKEVIVHFCLSLKSYARWNVKTDKLEMKYQNIPWPCHHHSLFTILCNENTLKKKNYIPMKLVDFHELTFSKRKKKVSWKFFKQLFTQEMQSRKIAPASPVWNLQRLLLCSFNSGQKIEPSPNSLSQDDILENSSHCFFGCFTLS